VSNNKKNKQNCQFCNKSFAASELFPAAMIRPAILEFIHKERPDWSSEGFICHVDLNRFRTAYVEQMLATERGELSALEIDVLESLRQHETLATDTNIQFDESATFGERLSDRIASFGGSWTFLISFGCLLVVWILINSLLFLWRPFDPYPFILLNLLLSCLAAIQAPVIMMSQNRQEVKDRIRAENDYRVNLKAELEIRHLHSKLDLLLTHQWQRLLEIQEIQLEVMEQISEHNNKK
jgi:uncharacterized membrane protein